MATSPKKAMQKANENLNDNVQDLRDDLERNIARMLPDYPRATGRGGQYTQRVRDLVAQEYRDAGWIVQDGIYWMELVAPSEHEK